MSQIIFQCQEHRFVMIKKSLGWSAQIDGKDKFYFPKHTHTLEQALLDLEVMIEDNELEEFAL